MNSGADAPPETRQFSGIRTALVHDWLQTLGGSERVLSQFLRLFSKADVYTLVDFMGGEDRALVGANRITTSFLQRLPAANRGFRRYLPLMPFAIEQFDLSEYDVVVSSSHAVAKGVLTGPDQLHVSYVHSPMRYAWDLQHQYLHQSGLDRGAASWLVRAVLHYLRTWDVASSQRVDWFIANSKFIARRIWKTYRRSAEVVYPPVDVDEFELSDTRDSYYLTTSRLVPYKRVDVIVEAFRAMPHRRLVVVGDGPEMSRLRQRATKNVELLGWQPREDVVRLTQRAQAFVYAAVEDFGIAPVEAQACGTPVIALATGGTGETVMDRRTTSPTGVLFDSQTPDAIIAAIREYESFADSFDPSVIRRHSLQFSPAAFRTHFAEAFQRAWEAFGR